MVSGERPKTLHRGEKTANTSLEVRFRACDQSSTRCRGGVYGMPSSALQVHHGQWHCCDTKSYTLHTWQEGILSKFKPKARQDSSSAPTPLPWQHLHTAHPDKATTLECHEAEEPHSCHRQQGWSIHVCHCRDLAQRAESPALCCTAHHLSSN